MKRARKKVRDEFKRIQEPESERRLERDKRNAETLRGFAALDPVGQHRLPDIHRLADAAGKDRGSNSVQIPARGDAPLEPTPADRMPEMQRMSEAMAAEPDESVPVRRDTAPLSDVADVLSEIL